MTTTNSGGDGSINQIFTDGGSPFYWDNIIFNVGGGVFGTTTYTNSYSTFTYPYYKIPKSGYYKISYSIGNYTTGGLFLKSYIVRETGPNTGIVILATTKDQPPYKEYNDCVSYFDVGDKVWMKRGGWDLSGGTIILETQDPYAYFSGLYLGTN
jgi:hypothetical protein